MECQCQVCQALAYLTAKDATRQVAQQLPEDVRLVLAAQQRVRDRRPLQGDEQLVQAAARRCSAGRFRLRPDRPH